MSDQQTDAAAEAIAEKPLTRRQRDAIEKPFACRCRRRFRRAEHLEQHRAAKGCEL